MAQSRDACPLPSYLLADQLTEPEHIPMQVLLLTHEVANLRRQMSHLAGMLIGLGMAISPPDGDPTDVSHHRSADH